MRLMLKSVFPFWFFTLALQWCNAIGPVAQL
jgi:hypothetical protein